jgi:uncharacterized protein (TIGR02001 family)
MQHMKLIAAAVLMAVGTTAYAADKTPVTGNVSLTSNYVWRGISQTAKQMAIQGGFDYAHGSGAYVGIWGSNVNFGDTGTPAATDRAQLETDLYAGYKFKAAGLDLDVGLLHYMYPGAAGSFKYDFTEVYVGATMGPFSAKYSYASDFQGTTQEAGSYLDLSASKEFGGITFAAHVGKSFGSGVEAQYAGYGGEYIDYKLSATKDFGGLGVSLSFTSTDFTTKTPAGDNGAADGMVMISVMKSL